MSSGFVSGGTTDAPIERSDEWLAAQQEIEATRARKAAEAHQSNGRSLFETLEANKAAKQDAFEEANRLKNQFRALDEDEVEFLDSVLERTRAEEERVRKETAEGLALFRRQQDEADKKAQGSEGSPAAEGLPMVEEEQWVAAGRKRKRMKEKEVLKGVKIRRSSSANEQSTNFTTTTSPAPSGNETASNKPKSDDSSTKKVSSSTVSVTSQVVPSAEPPLKPSSASDSSGVAIKKAPAAASPPKGGISLVAYGSDDDSD